MKTNRNPNQQCLPPAQTRARRLHWGGWVFALCLLGSNLTIRGQDPIILNTNNPADVSASLGATATFQVMAFSTNSSWTYQWQHAGTNLPGATSSTLNITNISLADAGSYVAWVDNLVGGVTNSRTAILTVDPTFIKIMTGPGGTDAAGSIGAAWGDMDGNGLPDLIIANSSGSGTARNVIWKNNGSGAFTKITTGNPVLDTGRWWYPFWVDYDNDGDLDLHVLAASGYPDKFYRNDGNGVFTPVTPEFVKISPYGFSNGELAAWFDSNNDGWLDAFIPRSNGNDMMFHGGPGGIFQSMTSAEVGPLVNAPSYMVGAIFDYDNDNRQDVLVEPLEGSTSNLLCRLFHNEGDGLFSQVTEGNLANQYCAPNGLWIWNLAVGDYDNDGDMDVFAPGGEDGYRGRLWRNEGNGDFTNVAAVAGVDRPLNALFATWVDYDNDGFLDLFLETGAAYNPPQIYGSTNVMFRNNGDGTFTPVELGSPLRDGVRRYCMTWVDYDRDGLLDCFLSCGNATAERNHLYRNNLAAAGNTNRWLEVHLVGKASNSKGVDAKVKVSAVIGGRTVTQLRQITVPGSVTQEDYAAHFGLGDATNVTTLQIEWPSGIVQELTNVAPNQFLTVVESQIYTGPAPEISGATHGAGGLQLAITEPAAPARYVLEASSDLVNWTKLMARTSAGGTANFTDTATANYPQRFYRLSVP